MKKLSLPLSLLLLYSSFSTSQIKAFSFDDVIKEPATWVITGSCTTAAALITWLATRKEDPKIAEQRAAAKERETAALKAQSNIEVQKQQELNKEAIEHHKQKQEQEIQEQKIKEQKQFEQKVQQAQQLVKRIGIQYTCTAGANDLERFAKENYNAINYKTPHLLFYNDVKKDLELLMTHQPFLSKQDFEPIHNFLNRICQGLNQYHGETISNQQYYERNAKLEYEKKLLELKQAEAEVKIKLETDEMLKQQKEVLNKTKDNLSRLDQASNELNTMNKNIVTLNNNILQKIDQFEKNLQNNEAWKNLFKVLDQTAEHRKQAEFRQEQNGRWAQQNITNEQIARQLREAIELIKALHNRPAPYNPEATAAKDNNPPPSFYNNPHGSSSSNSKF